MRNGGLSLVESQHGSNSGISRAPVATPTESVSGLVEGSEWHLGSEIISLIH